MDYLGAQSTIQVQCDNGVQTARPAARMWSGSAVRDSSPSYFQSDVVEGMSWRGNLREVGYCKQFYIDLQQSFTWAAAKIIYYLTVRAFDS